VSKPWQNAMSSGAVTKLQDCNISELRPESSERKLAKERLIGNKTFGAGLTNCKPMILLVTSD
jgi:hypothetical protein